MDSDSSAREAHFTREEKGIETIATMTVLKKERPDSLGADKLCYMTVINRTQTSVEDVHNYIRCIIMYKLYM